MNDVNLNSINGADEQTSKRPSVVIVGGVFGGLAAAKALGKAPVEVILIDRTNHHVFQPLLYQVATSVLAPSQMSSPIREILRRQKNTTVIMGEVTGVDKSQRCVFVSDADREHVPVPSNNSVSNDPDSCDHGGSRISAGDRCSCFEQVI